MRFAKALLMWGTSFTSLLLQLRFHHFQPVRKLFGFDHLASFTEHFAQRLAVRGRALLFCEFAARVHDAK
jgi:hypothetical protein